MLYTWLTKQENQLINHYESDFIHHFSKHTKLNTSMVIGQASQARLISECESKHRYLLCSDIPSYPTHGVTPCITKYDELPLDEDCVDLLILPHMLEKFEHPGRFLEEAIKLVHPEGYLLIFSLQANGTLHFKTRKKAPSDHIHWQSANKTCHILKKQGIEIISVEKFFSPFAHYHEDQRFYKLLDKGINLLLPTLCNAHIIIAKKHTMSSTPIISSFLERRKITLARRGIVNSRSYYLPIRKINE